VSPSFAPRSPDARRGPARSALIVELEHRHLDRHGDGWEAVREGVDSEGGWPTYLQRFADVLSG
jgi:hypothetical protein